MCDKINCRICKALEFWDKADNKKRRQYLEGISPLIEWNKYKLILSILITEGIY